MTMTREWIEECHARKERVPTNIDEFIDSVKAGVQLMWQPGIPVSMVSKLPNVPQEDALYYSSRDAEPVIVVYDSGDGHEVAVSESFVKACYKGEHGGIEYSLDMLAGMICRAMEPYIIVIV